MKNNYRGVILSLSIFLLFSLIVSFLNFRVLIDLPLAFDEADEATMGWQLMHVGPKTFVSSDKGGLGMELSHALLYTFSHGLVQYLFGKGNVSLRIYGMFHFLLSFFIMLGIIHLLIKDRFRKIIAFLVAGIMYFINPLLVQHSVVVNSDNNILTTTLLLFIYFYIYFEHSWNIPSNDEYSYNKISQGKTRNIILIVLLALSFWAKETTPTFLVVGIAFYRILSKDWKKFLNDFFIVSVGGILLFWFTWWLYCILTGTDVLGFIKFTIIGKGKYAFSSRYIKSMIATIVGSSRWALYWVSGPFFIMVIMCLIKRAKRYFESKKLDSIDFLLIVGSIIWIVYHFFRPNPDMMKYQYPAYPLFIIVISVYMSSYLIRLSPKIYLPIFIFLAIIIAHYYWVGDYILVLSESIFDRKITLTNHLNGHFLFYYWIPPVIIILGAILVRKNFMRNIILGCFFLTIGINAGLLFNQSQANYCTFEIWLNYGERGLKDVGEYLTKNVSSNDIVSARKDIFYYLEYIKGKKFIKGPRPREILGIRNYLSAMVFFARAPVKYIVLDRISLSVPFHPMIAKLINSYYRLVKVAGNFYVYERKVKE